MDFDYTEEQTLLRETVRKFAKEKLLPRIPRGGEQHPFAYNHLKEFSQLGFLGMPILEQYGGMPLDGVSEAIVIEELSRCDAAFGFFVAMHSGLVCRTISNWGTEEQKKFYLPLLASGEKYGVCSPAEIGSISEAENFVCRAEKKGDKYVLNGTKFFSSDLTVEDFAIVFAKDTEKDSQISAFIVPKNSNGFRNGEFVSNTGLGGFVIKPFTLTDVVVPEENVIGGEGVRGKGLELLLDIIPIGKLGIAARSLGLAERALEEAIKYSSERVQRKKPIQTYPTIQTLIAEMATEIEASRWMLYHAASQREKGKNISLEGAMAKLFCTRTAKRVIDKALSVHGCYGYTKDFIIERLYREVKLGELYEGTHEMQKILIASKILSKR